MDIDRATLLLYPITRDTSPSIVPRWTAQGLSGPISLPLTLCRDLDRFISGRWVDFDQLALDLEEILGIPRSLLLVEGDAIWEDHDLDESLPPTLTTESARQAYRDNEGSISSTLELEYIRATAQRWADRWHSSAAQRLAEEAYEYVL